MEGGGVARDTATMDQERMILNGPIGGSGWG